MNNTHHVNNKQISALLKLLAACLLPMFMILVFMAMGIESYSLGGFIPYLMLIFCPIAYLMMEYPKLAKHRIIDNIKNKLKI